MSKNNFCDYTILILAKNEPFRIIPLLQNLKSCANVIVLLDANDSSTESMLIDSSTNYIRRPGNFEELSEEKKTEWILSTSPTDYVLICFCSFYIPSKLLEVFAIVARERKYDAVKNASIYWSHGRIVQKPTFFKKSNSCYFLNRKKVCYSKVSIHNEYAINDDAKILTLPPIEDLSLNIFRDDDMIAVSEKHIGYADREARNLLNYSENISYATIIYKPLRAFVNNYIRMGGFRAGVPGLIYHINYSIYIFLVYARLWELQNSREFSNNRVAHQNIKLNLIRKHESRQNLKL